MNNVIDYFCNVMRDFLLIQIELYASTSGYAGENVIATATATATATRKSFPL